MIIKEFLLKSLNIFDVFNDYFVVIDDKVYVSQYDFDGSSIDDEVVKHKEKIYEQLKAKGYISSEGCVLDKFYNIKEEDEFKEVIDDGSARKKLFDVLEKRIKKKITFSKFNIFVGGNNSGKSRFMRELAKSFMFGEISQPNSRQKSLNFLPITFAEVKDFYSFINNIKLNNISNQQTKNACIPKNFDFSWLLEWKRQLGADADLQRLKEQQTEENKTKIDNLVEITNFVTSTTDKEGKNKNAFVKVYIPTIRGLKGFYDKEKKIINDCYCVRTQKDYFLNKIKDDVILKNITGGGKAPEMRRYKDYYTKLVREGFIKQTEAGEYLTDKFLYTKTWFELPPEVDVDINDIYNSLRNTGIQNFEDINIFTGLNLYEDIKAMLLGEEEDRKKIKDFQKFLGDTFFNNKVTLIPKIKDDVLHIKIGTEKEFPIYNLGDGIQSIIIMTFPLFKYKGENLLLFIEEPEIYIHPSLQRNLLDVFLSSDYEKYNQNVQYFITTHSNHFLDLTIEQDQIAILTFKKKLLKNDKEDKFRFEIEKIQSGYESPLKLLGVRNSSIYLSNCTIWVEGVTDRLYIRKYLKIYEEYKKNEEENFTAFQEDVHYSFVEYGGNNITHFSFLEEYNEEKGKKEPTILVDRLCGKLFLIADKDSGKEDRHNCLKEHLGDADSEKFEGRFYCLKAKEIENLLSEQVLLATVKKMINNKDALTIKNEDFKYENYKNEPLGEFIDNEILKLSGDKSKFFTEGKTIAKKRNFCDAAIINIKEWEDLSIEAQDLTKKVYNFIKKNNDVS